MKWNFHVMQKEFDFMLTTKASKMTFLAGQQASKCKTNYEAPPAESSKIAPEPQQEATADQHCLDFNLA